MPRTQAVGDILIDVIQREGLQTFTSLLRKRAFTVRKLPTAMKSFAGLAFDQLGGVYREIRESGLKQTSRARFALLDNTTRSSLKKARQLPDNVKGTFLKARDHYLGLASSRERTEFIVLLAVFSASYLGGIVLGFQIPHGDLKVFQKANPKNLIKLYSAPLLSVEIALEWMQAMLQKTLSRPELATEDRKALQNVEKIFLKLAGGVATGVAAGEIRRGLLRGKKGAKAAAVPIALGDKAYQVVEELFSSLSETKPQ